MERIENLKRRVAQLMGEGKYHDVIKLLTDDLLIQYNDSMLYCDKSAAIYSIYHMGYDVNLHKRYIEDAINYLNVSIKLGVYLLNFYMRGKCWLLLNNTQMALLDLNEAANITKESAKKGSKEEKLDKNSLEILYIELFSLSKKSNDFDSALAYLNEAYAIQNSPKIIEEIFRLYFEYGRIEKAKLIYDSYVNRLSNNVNLNKLYASLLFQYFGYEEAEKVTQEIFHNTDKIAECKYSMAMNYYYLRKYARSLELLDNIKDYYSNNAEFFNWFGILLEKLDRTQEALDSYRKILEIENDSLVANVNLALLYFKIGKYNNSYDYFCKAYNLIYTGKIQSDYVIALCEKYIFYNEILLNRRIKITPFSQAFGKYFLRIISRIENIDIKILIKSLISKIEGLVEDLKQISCFAPPMYIAHYTKLSVVDKIIGSNSQSRLIYYNASSMNDPEEGTIIHGFLFGGSVVEGEDRLQNIIKYREDSDCNVYLGSFLPATDSLQNKDSLQMWRTYGKGDNGVDAAGACMVMRVDYFDKETTYFNYRKSYDIILSNRIASRTENRHNQSLFKVYYLNKQYEVVNALEQEKKEIEDCMSSLKMHCNKYFKVLDSIKDSELKSDLEKVVFDIVSQVNYLFKSSDYSFENEYRVIQYAEATDSIVKIDETQFPKKLYIESNKDPRNHLVEVVLGPKIADRNHWLYLSKLMHTYNPDFKLTKSTIKFQ